MCIRASVNHVESMFTRPQQHRMALIFAIRDLASHDE